VAGVSLSEDARAVRALRFGQARTLLLLFLGYASCYFCRSDLSVATPLLLRELAKHGIPHDVGLVEIGTMISLSVGAYALGKVFLTGLGDYWGGKRNLLIATGGAAAFTLLFAASSTLPFFTLAWIGNRLTQSIGWSSLVKVSSKWFHYSRYGTVAAILTCSYLVGDAAARQSMGALLDRGFGWRALFLFGAGVAACMFFANLLFLRESRVDEGHAEAEANPRNLFASGQERPASWWQLVAPLLRSRAFVTVCLLGLACTTVRETFNTWTPEYLSEYAGYTVSSAASLSAVFPGVGAVSVLLAGWMSDRLGANSRALILTLGLLAAAVMLVALVSLPPGTGGRGWHVVTIALVAFCLFGPYSFLAGAFALDYGGKQAGAVASGLVDGAGYAGGALAGTAMAKIAVAFGWGGVFTTLAALCAVAALGSAYLHLLNLKAVKAAVARPAIA
jgi:sugar phosphate permease